LLILKEHVMEGSESQRRSQKEAKKKAERGPKNRERAKKGTVWDNRKEERGLWRVEQREMQAIRENNGVPPGRYYRVLSLHSHLDTPVCHNCK
jgi:hypothetical protein